MNQTSSNPLRALYPTRKAWLSAKHNARRKSQRLLKRMKVRKCVRCGSDELRGPKAPTCHHIDGNPFNHAIDNLEWLCRDCHDDEHGIVRGMPAPRRPITGHCVSINAEANRRAFFAKA